MTAPAGGLPATVREAVLGRLARLARLSAPARKAVEAVAVIGPPAPLRLVGAVMPKADAALEEAVAGDMLHADGSAIAFRHELARLAVLDTVPGPPATAPPGAPHRM
ncbi:hypothetical protein ACFZCP_38560 [Streptomyces sp. NPDC007971]|uniref:hypothetical protein n=1 Tax=Streptomyces sp. NPDC007971 TaxID=3364799 RepID=UPI0036EB2656